MTQNKLEEEFDEKFKPSHWIIKDENLINPVGNIKQIKSFYNTAIQQMIKECKPNLKDKLHKHHACMDCFEEYEFEFLKNLKDKYGIRLEKK